MKTMTTSKRALALIALMLTMHINIFGESFDSLWKKAKEAQEKDLPKTELEILGKIVDKAERQRAYGQLMTAELKVAQVSCDISPDSLSPAVERMKARAEAVADAPLRAVYMAVLGRIYADNGQLAPGEAYSLSKSYYRRAMENPRELARVKAVKYRPLVTPGVDSRIFGDDLLSLIGIWTDDYATLHHYYDSVGNRAAACLTALELVEDERPYGRVEVKESPYLKRLDSLIARYGDMQEAGQVAIERYSYLDRNTYATAAQKLDYIHEALGRWGTWKGIGELRNKEKELTQSQFMARMEESVATSSQQQIKLSNIRNIGQLTVSLYRVDGDGTLSLNPTVAKDYDKLKPLLTPMPERTVTRVYSGRKNYELFEDTVTLDPLPVGVYMVEIGTATLGVGKDRRLLKVSNLRLMAQGMPGDAQRLVVVDATSGHPVAGAKLRVTVKNYRERNKVRTLSLTTNTDGEAMYTLGEREYVATTLVYTDDDRALPEIIGAANYQFSPSTDGQYTDVFTDRSIYRPGQTVHAAAITYGVSNSIRQKVEQGVQVEFVLYGANHRRIDAKTAVTDQWGTATADFTLPTDELTGNFTIMAGRQASCMFKVEEYKRPTFEVTFDKVDKAYEPGDTVTLRGKAMSYAGVPVQQAKVSYTVARRRAWWWWRYSSYYETLVVGNSPLEDVIAQGETTTDGTGALSIDVPMMLPETDHPLFYNIIVRADVTDQGGETHRGETQLALGNRKTAFGCTLERQVLIDKQPKYMFTYNNASGFEIDGSVNFRIDEQPWQQAPTNSELSLPRLPSGAHTLEAICGSDTLKREFTVFSLDDQRPCTTTDDWFYVEDTRFRDAQSPLTVQVGSSRSDVYIYYSVCAGNSVIESGHVVRSNELVNRKLTYQEEYGDAVLLTFAWVKDGKFYHHATTIERPLPKKELKLAWKTFRDRLLPGQQEQWTLTVTTPDGKPAEAQLMATLYDQSLDQLYPHGWSLVPRYRMTHPSVDWLFRRWGGLSFSAYRHLDKEKVEELQFTTFDESLFPMMHLFRRYRTLGAGLSEPMLEAQPMMMAKNAVATNEAFDSVNDEAATRSAKEATADVASEAKETDGAGEGEGAVQLRENLAETAFFYPQLTTDGQGRVAISFTLPESLTTWRFMGVAHTKDMCHGMITAQTIAQKDVMAQPNVPRFVRHGDQATIAVRLVNTSGHAVSGTARMELIDPETGRTVYTDSQPFTLDTDATTTATFDIDTREQRFQELALLVCRATAVGKGFSDGEQHYLPLLPSAERVTVSRPFTQNEPGTATIDLRQLVPADAWGGKLTVEYTNNPAWLIVQALPTMSIADEENAISLAAAYYANSLGKFMLDQIPNAKTTFELWQQEKGKETSLMSNLEKNQELKDILLNETPWVLDAESETAQKQRLANFFDTNNLRQRTDKALEMLAKLQHVDGAWSWWEGMSGSFWMTVEISEMLVRLNAMTGNHSDTKLMLDRAFNYMQGEMAQEVERLKEMEKKGNTVSFPTYKALQYLYICALDGRKLPSSVQKDNDYLVKLLRKDIKIQDLYDKAVTAIILHKYDPKVSQEYVQSLKEYTVYNEEKGRYYDTHRAGYSWRDYRIPTQVAAIEAIGRITPDDRQTLLEMQRWLLQEKRTTCWDTPINSVNAIYAFLTGNKDAFAPQERTRLSIDGKPLELPRATAGIGYVKTSMPAKGNKMFTAEKSSEGVSWGAVYAQFMQHTSNIAASASGITVRRTILVGDINQHFKPLASGQKLKVGDRIRVEITIEAERDYDFVQLLDQRAACMEPVHQLSGYNNGAYCAPKDNSTNYYYDRLYKGRHTVATEYYIDRAGTYETGTCSVECAYAPEYRAKAPSATLIVEP